MTESQERFSRERDKLEGEAFLAEALECLEQLERLVPEKDKLAIAEARRIVEGVSVEIVDQVLLRIAELSFQTAQKTRDSRERDRILEEVDVALQTLSGAFPTWEQEKKP